MTSNTWKCSIVQSVQLLCSGVGFLVLWVVFVCFVGFFDLFLLMMVFDLFFGGAGRCFCWLKESFTCF